MRNNKKALPPHSAADSHANYYHWDSVIPSVEKQISFIANGGTELFFWGARLGSTFIL
jgi:hypothetical protein